VRLVIQPKHGGTGIVYKPFCMWGVHERYESTQSLTRRHPHIRAYIYAYNARRHNFRAKLSTGASKHISMHTTANKNYHRYLLASFAPFQLLLCQ